MRKILILLFSALLLMNSAPACAAEGTFTDTRFQGVYTTENLDAIIEAYDLYDGWYWSTQADVYQNYHAQEDKKAWTQSSRDYKEYFAYTWGWFGCRWNWDVVDPLQPNADGWGECFGFAQFLGYLLSGERNPHRNWVAFHSMLEAGGLKPGDIVRIEYTDEAGFHQHSAMVYSVDEERGKALFLQASGSNYNKLYMRQGYNGAALDNTKDISDIAKCPGLRILRSEDNLDGRYPWGWVSEKEE